MTQDLFIDPTALNRFFTDAGARLAAEEALKEVKPEELIRFFSQARHQLELAEKQDRTEASGFNVFDLIRPDENRISDVLALLLNPRGAHGQGDLFLRLLIKKLNTGLNLKDTKHAKVWREASTHKIDNSRRRIDVLVDAGDLVAIENKVNADEEPGQIKDYLEHLRLWTEGRSVRSTLIYLTPGGRLPDSLQRENLDREVADNRLRCWSYGRHLCTWLEMCRRQCEAPRFRDFLSDFIHYIQLKIERDSETEPELENYEH